ncbi:hypothetical protein S40285_01307 [Stachybotrys chlorohalonatus IBT 40285]|uniref:Uncharacterized protein n=2 Tax=Stachybotrys TaxID=74721 RepID=A0A084QQW4_STAC4|nr:hypothetical protein S7711_07355 [Stachybotrys chartarum IBT 7711]KFA52079.1 hypothetical protein S40293_02937 [Stachybotrys chartarum IBT 40293]KFA66349.1 hypothetical protein S40285_01307 [Stachybotrys chlorohalonata IBT 40285]KFA74152.1 hypothetical protein S40288_06538 [Stachybotrys chartarum IBT 40288]
MSDGESLFDLRDVPGLDEKDDVDSLPSDSTSDIYSDADSEAQAEWERSLEQLQLLLTMMIVPWMGKYFGRKFAYWSWARYMEWAHNVEVRWTNKKAFKVAGAVEAATSL